MTVPIPNRTITALLPQGCLSRNSVHVHVTPNERDLKQKTSHYRGKSGASDIKQRVLN